MKTLCRWVVRLLICASSVSAQGPTAPAHVPEDGLAEPIVTEETLPNEVGEWDIRWSNEYRRLESGSTMQSPRMQLFFGITDRLGGDIDVSFVRARSDARRYGPGDIETSVKWLLVAPSSGRPAITVGWEFGWPTGSVEKGTGEGAVEVHPFVGLLKDFGSFNVQGDIGWSRAIDGEEHDKAVPYNWAVAVPLNRPETALMLEINGSVGLGGEDSLVAVAPGIRYGLRERMSVAIAVPIGLTAESEQWGIVAQWQVGF